MTEITPLHGDDRPRWAELWRAYLAFYETTLPDAQFDNTWTRLASARRRAPRPRRPARRRPDRQTHYLFHPTAWSSAPACYLQDLFVDPTARGTGAGRALIEAVAERAREAQACRLYWLTQTGNAVARRLYDRLARDNGFMRYDYPLYTKSLSVWLMGWIPESAAG